MVYEYKYKYLTLFDHNIRKIFLETDRCAKGEYLNKDVVRLISKLNHKIVDMEHKVSNAVMLYIVYNTK